MTDLSNEVKALLEEAGIWKNVIVDPVKNSNWCCIVTPLTALDGDNVNIYIRRMEKMNLRSDEMVELSDWGQVDFNVEDKNLICTVCSANDVLYGINKRTDIHTAVVLKNPSFSNTLLRLVKAIHEIDLELGRK